MTAAIKNISFKWVHADQKTPKPKDLITYYNHMKLINKIVLKFRAARVNSNTWPIGNEWTADLDIIKTVTHSAKLLVFPLPDILTKYNVKNVRKSLLIMYHNLKALSRIEKTNISNQRIKYFIDQRCLQYESNPGKMIQSALGRSKKTIVLDRLMIRYVDGHLTLINDPDLIKHYVNKHF